MALSVATGAQFSKVVMEKHRLPAKHCFSVAFVDVGKGRIFRRRRIRQRLRTRFFPFRHAKLRIQILFDAEISSLAEWT
jgi:hypothetical protein